MPIVIQSRSIDHETIATSLLLDEKAIWSWSGKPFTPQDLMVNLERIVASLLSARNIRSIVLRDVVDHDVSVSLLTPIYRVIPVGYSDFHAMMRESQSSLSVDGAPMTPKAIIETLAVVHDGIADQLHAVNQEAHPEEIMSRVDEPDTLTMRNRNEWIRAQEDAYLANHQKNETSPLDAARQRLKDIRFNLRAPLSDRFLL